MIHLDLFSGIGGFAYAADQVWENCEHIFCEIDPFCRAVLKKHWKDAIIYEDIKTVSSSRIIADTESIGDKRRIFKQDEKTQPLQVNILTGGFPCQPFSVAGRKRGKEDDRYLWYEMFRIISETKPHWVIGENVTGIVNMVLHEVCADLESEGYETQCFIIPACAVNAPHRRDRVWIVAHTKNANGGGCGRRDNGNKKRSERTLQIAGHNTALYKAFTNASSEGQYKPKHKRNTTNQKEIEAGMDYRFERQNWNRNWIEVAAEFCGVDDGLSVKLDGFKLSVAGHWRERIKALGNSIVPQIAIEIMKAIKQSENLFKNFSAGA